MTEDPATPSGPGRLLVVDDDPDVRTLVSTVLRSIGGYVVETADDGADAIERLQDEAAPTPDLVVLDIMMPRTDGLTTLSWIREHDYHYDLPVVMLTARSGVGDEALGWKRGCDAYVAKPFDPEQLVEVVATTLAAGPELRIARRSERLRDLLASSI